MQRIRRSCLQQALSVYVVTTESRTSDSPWRRPRWSGDNAARAVFAMAMHSQPHSLRVAVGGRVPASVVVRRARSCGGDAMTRLSVVALRRGELGCSLRRMAQNPHTRPDATLAWRPHGTRTRGAGGADHTVATQALIVRTGGQVRCDGHTTHRQLCSTNADSDGSPRATVEG